MTRLEKHKQKVFYQKVAAMVVLLLLLISFLFFVGFQFILKSSGFVGSLGKNSENQTSQTDTFFGTLSVDDLPSATNSAQFVISGSVTNYERLEFYINGSKVSNALVHADSFNKTIGDLKKGSNSVYVKALTNDDKNSKISDTFTLIYKNDKPKLDISQPSDNSKTDNPELKVVGNTDKGVTIRVNNSPTVVDVNGGFQQTFSLKEGDNKIEIDAVDDAGNTEHKELTVNYQKD